MLGKKKFSQEPGPFHSGWFIVLRLFGFSVGRSDDGVLFCVVLIVLVYRGPMTIRAAQDSLGLFLPTTLEFYWYETRNYCAGGCHIFIECSLLDRAS